MTTASLGWTSTDVCHGYICQTDLWESWSLVVNLLIFCPSLRQCFHQRHRFLFLPMVSVQHVCGVNKSKRKCIVFIVGHPLVWKITLMKFSSPNLVVVWTMPCGNAYSNVTRVLCNTALRKPIPYTGKVAQVRICLGFLRNLHLSCPHHFLSTLHLLTGNYMKALTSYNQNPYKTLKLQWQLRPETLKPFWKSCFKVERKWLCVLLRILFLQAHKHIKDPDAFWSQWLFIFQFL